MNGGPLSTRGDLGVGCQWAKCPNKATTVTRFVTSFKEYKHCDEHVAVLAEAHPESFVVVRRGD